MALLYADWKYFSGQFEYLKYKYLIAWWMYNYYNNF